MTSAFTLLVDIVLLLSESACTGPTHGNSQAALPEDLTAPTPFVLQFVGTYADGDPGPGAMSRLELRRDGSYEAMVRGGDAGERGAFVGSARRELPLTLYSTQHDAWSATVDAYDNQVRVTRDGHVSTLHALEPVGPVEALCEATSGVWKDDDPDVNTGLYCVCPSPRVYIPSGGGCVP